MARLRIEILAAALVATALWGGGAAAVPGEPVTASPSLACAGVPCRSGTAQITLRAEDGVHAYDLQLDPVPYVSNGAIKILPGESLVFHFAPADGAPGVPQFVRQNAATAPSHMLTDDPSVKVRRDPKTGETYSFAGRENPALENGTAEDHLRNAPPGTMIVSYFQVAGRANMLLTIEHNLPMALKYDATMNRLRPNGNTVTEPTSTCPAKPAFLATEMWPYPIGVMTLSDFRFVDISAGLHCE